MTVRNLELVAPLFSGQDDRATLFRALDVCLTPMGKRLLRATILRPLNDATEIEARYEAVAEALGDLLKREEIRAGVWRDSRFGTASGENLSGFGRAARCARASSEPGAAAGTEDGARCDGGADVGARSATDLDPLDDVTARIVKTLVAEPPLTLVDGGAIAAGIDAELDELRSISSSGRQAIAAIEDRERQRTGIGSLKVRYNSVFGYYIEITKAQHGACSGRLRAQTDAGECGAVYDAGTEGVRAEDSLCARPVH